MNVRSAIVAYVWNREIYSGFIAAILCSDELTVWLYEDGTFHVSTEDGHTNSQFRRSSWEKIVLR